MILNGIDCGATSNPWPKFQPGQTVGSQLVEGSYTVVWPRGGTVKKQTVAFIAKAWQGIGGASANTTAAARYLARQLEQLALNRDVQPVYIQWWATADPGAVLNSTSHHDGWYVIDSLLASYDATLISGLVKVQMTVSQVAPGVPARQAMWFSGAALSSTYSGASQIAIGYPSGSANQPATAITRAGGEGSIPVSVAPAANLDPLPFTPSATVGDWFKAGVHVYDTINTSSNPVPVAGGTFVNANWVEVYGADHRFEGDCVVTNGLHLYIFQTGQARAFRAYLWSTGLATPTWQQVADVTYSDTGSNAGTVRGYTVSRVGGEVARVTVQLSTSASKWAEVGVRMVRGHYESAIDFKPLSEANTIVNALQVVPAQTLKAAYNSGSASDPAVSASTLTTPTDYGYVAAFTNNASYPYIVGALSQGGVTKLAATNTSASLGFSDTDGPAQNAIRTYGFFAIPFGVNASYSPANLQAEAESGAISAPWASVADASASGGNAVKLPSGSTAGGQSVLWGSIPNALAPGSYQPWFRVKVSSNAGATADMYFGLWLSTPSWAPGSPVAIAPNSLAGSGAYYWTKGGLGPVTLPVASASVQFRCQAAATTGEDWYVDEAVLLPVTLSADNRGPQEIWQQFLYDAERRWTVG